MSMDAHEEHRRAEAWALAGGGLVVLAWIGLLALAFARAPLLARNLLAQALAHAVLGRETGIPAGLATGTPWPLVALAVALQDAAILLVGYGVLAAALRGAEHARWVRRLVEAAEARVAPFARRTRRVGVALLALSLWIPFLPSGALTAALVGRAAGYPPRVLLPALLASLTCAAILTTALYAGLGALLGPSARWILVAAAFAVTILVALIGWLRARR